MDKLYYSNVPDEMTARERWCYWTEEPPRKPGGKPNKVSRTPSTNAMAKSDNPQTWRSFKLATLHNGSAKGLTFALGDGWVGGDLDHATVDDVPYGQPKPWAQWWLDNVSAYWEHSPSGTGYRFIAFAGDEVMNPDSPDELLRGRRTKVHVDQNGQFCFDGERDPDGGEIELYSNKRFLTITGNILPCSSPTIEMGKATYIDLRNRITKPRPKTESAPCRPVDASDQELLDAMLGNPANGAAIRALWEGDASAFGGDHSAADQALCNHLAFYTGNDAGRMDRLFRLSGLMRDKWDKRPDDYAKPTIDRAIAVTSKFWIQYRGNLVEEPPFDDAREAPPVDELDDLPNVPTAQGDTGQHIPQTPETWELFTLADAYKPRPPLTYVVDGLFPLPSLSVVYGAPGCLKSMLLADMALSVAAGRPWLPSADDEPHPVAPRSVVAVPVLWLDFDNGKRRTDERIDAIGSAYGLEASKTSFFYTSMPSPWLDGNSALSIEGLVELARNVSAGVIIIDNLGAVSGDADENSGDMVQVLSNFRYLSERTGAAVVLVHHQRKSNGGNARTGETLRGHSSIEAALDLALLVERDEGAPHVKVQSTKTRGVDVFPFGAHFAYNHREGTRELARACFHGVAVKNDSKPARAREAIADALRESSEPINKTALVKMAREICNDGVAEKERVGVKYIRDAIAQMVSDGDITESETGHKNARVYTVPVSSPTEKGGTLF